MTHVDERFLTGRLRSLWEVVRGFEALAVFFAGGWAFSYLFAPEPQLFDLVLTNGQRLLVFAGCIVFYLVANAYKYHVDDIAAWSGIREGAEDDEKRARAGEKLDQLLKESFLSIVIKGVISGFPNIFIPPKPPREGVYRRR